MDHDEGGRMPFPRQEPYEFDLTSLLKPLRPIAVPAAS